MSGAPSLGEAADDFVLDHGVLTAQPVLEFHGYRAVERCGGLAVLPWREHARAAAAAHVLTSPMPPLTSTYAQVVVRVGKGRAATEADLAAAWAALAPNGRLLVAGFNDNGIATWVKRIADRLHRQGRVLVNRLRGRVVAFEKVSSAQVTEVLAPPAPTTVPLASGKPLTVLPGVFSGDGLDAGTAALLRVVDAEAAAVPAHGLIADVGCGAGHLGVAASLAQPAARLLLLDADARAVASAQLNAPQAQCCWWDDHDPWPGPVADLALLNPPCHRGNHLDLGLAKSLFRAVSARRLLIVANRQLAYEADLRTLGDVEHIADDGRFKILALTR